MIIERHNQCRDCIFNFLSAGDPNKINCVNRLNKREVYFNWEEDCPYAVFGTVEDLCYYWDVWTTLRCNNILECHPHE